MDPALWELSESGSDDDEVSVIVRLQDASRPPDNIRVIARFGEIVTARLRRRDIRETWSSELVASMKASRPMIAPLPFDGNLAFGGSDVESLLASKSAAPHRRSIREDGTGVVMGICDWGLDFTHPNFRNEDGTTRLRALWDQRIREGEMAKPYGYGRVFTREEINAALQTEHPFKTLGYDLHESDRSNRGSHGTHVCDIAAGNGRAPGSTPGMAPGVELVFVQLTSARMEDLADFGDSVSLLEGLDFVRNTAGDDPCVLNLSAGKTGGEHRGTNPFEQAVDAMLTSRKNIALVQSVGNYAGTAMHSHARLGPDQTHTLRWIIQRGDRTPNELEIWYSGRDVFDVTMISPEGQRFSASLGDRVKLESDDTSWGTLYHRRLEPNSGLNHIDIFLQGREASGTWKIELHGQEIVDGRLHAWIERDASGRHQSRFPREQATSSYTTNTICNSFRAIAVGAYDASQPDRPPTQFSSRGPTADGRQKPELAAPGYRIRAARSTPRGGFSPGDSRQTVKSGTSMAAPHVAGTVAMMFQASERPLSINEVRRVLIGTADPHPGPSGRSSSQLGYGYLNTEAAVEAVRGLKGELPRPVRKRELGTYSETVFVDDGSGNEDQELSPQLAVGDEDFGDELPDEDFGDEDFGDDAFGDDGDHELGQELDDDEAEPPEYDYEQDEDLEEREQEAAFSTPASEIIAAPQLLLASQLGLDRIDREAAFRPRSTMAAEHVDEDHDAVAREGRSGDRSGDRW